MMIRRRTRDGGFHHVNIELLIVVAIIGILFAIAIPHLVDWRDRRGAVCLANLLALAEGKKPEKAVCPVSDKPYAPGPELVTCPDPEKHLDTKPSLARAEKGPWELRQTLPSSAGKTPDFADSRLEVSESPGRASVLVKPAGFMRFFLAPLLFLIFLVIVLLCLAGVYEGRKELSSTIGPLVGIAIAGYLGFLSLAAFAKSQEWILERSGARVTRVEYFFGKRTSERKFSGCLGVVPTLGKNCRLQLLHPPDGEGRRTTEIGLISKDRLDVAEWFNRALVGP